MRIVLVADGGNLPVAAGPPAGITPFAGYVEPFVRPRRVGVFRDEGLELVCTVFPDVDVVTNVWLENATESRMVVSQLTGENSKCNTRKT